MTMSGLYKAVLACYGDALLHAETEPDQITA